jgi:predicted nucleic acid-binding protein
LGTTGLAAHLKTSGRGQNFRMQDLWLASQAIQHGLKLLTHNRKDFEDLPGLDLVILSKPHME